MVVTTTPSSGGQFNNSEHQSLISSHDDNTKQQYHHNSEPSFLHHDTNPNFDVATNTNTNHNQFGRPEIPQPTTTTQLQIREQPLDPYYSSKVSNTSFSDYCCSSSASLFLVVFIVVAGISQIICEIVVYPYNLEDTLVQILPRVLVYVPMGLALLYYIILVFTCSTAKYLYNNDSASSIYDNVDRLTRARPIISLHVSCYHYETRYETYTDNEGRTQTRTTTHTVTTYTETRAFNYNFFRDVSKPFLLEGTDKKYMKLKLKQVSFMSNNETKLALDDARRKIQVENRWRDDYMSYSEHWSLDTTFKSNMLAKIKPEESSFFVSLSCYLLFSLFGLNSVYRFIFNRMCDTQEHLFVKEISVTPFPEQVLVVQQQQQPFYSPQYSSVFGQGSLQSVYGLNQTDYKPPQLIIPTNNPPPSSAYGGDYVPYQQPVVYQQQQQY